MTQKNLNDNQGFSIGNENLRGLGSIYTPLDLANYLTAWAISEPTCTVLDLGVGDGTFVLSAYDRLLKLGASKENARTQIYGAEKHDPAFKNFLNASARIGTDFPFVYPGDFFDIKFPQVEAVIGNPPYVRRMHLHNVEYLQESVSEYQASGYELPLSRLTDLYVYFLLRACSFLKPTGKLAVVIADSWLNVGYGQQFKQHLKTSYHIEKLVSFDQRFFDADVRPVLLLATKKGDLEKTNYS